ncbi:YadA-like family protein [Escherichia coli]|nr:YadA-like family protein [Escherichia coli]EJX7499419.1 YadA-like family protein [Escherichia coli]
MNKIFKVIWNPATGSYTVASETAKSRGKKSGRSKLLISALVAGGMLSSFGVQAQAGRDNGQGVNYGQGTGTGWVAIGEDAKANSFTDTGGGSSTAVGYHSTADGRWSTALGAKTHSLGEASVALGINTTSAGERSLAIGASATSTGGFSIALGRYANSTGEFSIAQGDHAETGADDAIAFGRESKALGIMSIALGATANASKEYAMALGASSAASAANAIAVGRNSAAAGVDSLAFGRLSAANAANAIAMGAESKAAENATAVGTNAEANGLNSIALGSGSIADVDNTIALGNQSQAVAAGAIAIGQGNKADGANAIALGNGSITGGVNAIALGQGSYAGLENGTAIGAQASAQGKNSVALGAGSVATDADTVSVGNTTAQRQIVNMAAGDISTTSTDAINGSQLYAISKSVADNLGGGATVNAQGVVTSPNYRLKSGIFGTVGDALTGLDNNTLQWDSLKKAYSAAHGTDTTSTITNVKDGAISDTSKDAVNGSQLKTTNDNVATNTANITTNTNSINTLTDSVGDLKDDALLWNGTAFSAAHGTEATSKITNVKDGDLTAGSTDAVNGSQLKTTNDNVATNTTNITNLTDSVGDLKDDALLWNGTAFSAAHGTDATSKITNVKDGDLTAGSTDAVNGSQLKTTNDAVAANTTNIATNTTNITNLTDAVDSLGDDSLLWNATAGAFSAAHSTDATSKITNVTAGDLTAGSTDAVNGSQLKTTNDAVAANTTNIATNTTNITNLTDAVDSLGDDSLLWNATAGAFSAAHGTEATSKITNVKDGDLTAGSTDAVNGSQLKTTNDAVAANTTNIATNTTNITNLTDAVDSLGDDSLLWNATAGAFSAAHGTEATSKITNVKDGDLTAGSTDAVNGSQLYDTSKYIANTLGGDAEVNADGTITAPTYAIAGGSYSNVGDALEAIDTTLDDALLWDATANDGAGAYNASHDGKASIITNVADGNIGEGSTDAINGSQLFNTNMLIQQNSEIINQLAGNTSETYIEDNGAGINYVRTNDNGLAFNDASASGIGATAVGYNAVASGESSVAIGQGSYSNVDTGIALGSSSVSSRVIVKGSRDTSVSEEGVVIGYDTTDGELLGALSIGDDGKYRQIINVADGSEAHDAVTVRQLQNAIGAVATTPTKYFHANSTEEDSLAVGEDSLAMGAKTIVNGNVGIGIGYGAYVDANALNGIAIGSNARANHANSIAMGSGSQTTRGAQTGYTAYNMDAPQNSVGEFSVGSEDGQRQITNVAAGSADTDAVNVGQLKVTDAQVSQNTQSITNLNNQVTNLDTRVTNIENGIGDIVTTGSTKYFKTNTDGVDANAQGKDSVAIGSGSIAAADNSVALGTGSVANEENTISVGSSTNQRRITNVAAGVNATDAVNVSQLKSSEAGGVRYDTKADGSVDYSNITLGGGNGGTTRISNVSAGVNNNDAVNYAQLKQSVQETKQYTDQRMVEMDNKLSKTESKLSGGIASAMAMTGLPQAYTPGASMASIGGGTYNGESAVALGVSMVSANGRWVYKLQGSTNSQGEYSAALGAGIQW